MDRPRKRNALSTPDSTVTKMGVQAVVSTPPTLFLVRALYDYSRALYDTLFSHQEYLDFEVGQIIHVTEGYNEDISWEWPTRHLEGSTRCGIFPIAYIERCGPEDVRKLETAARTSSPGS
jgi:hypothetical protein